MQEETSIFRIDFQGSDEIISRIAAIRKEQERLKNENKELSKEAKDGNLEAAKSYEKNQIQVKAYGREISQLTKTVTDQNKANKAAQGAYDQLSAQYALMKKELNSLGIEERENTKRGRDMEAQSKRVYDEMNRLQKLTGKHTLGVGDYAGGVGKAAKELGQFAMSGVQAGEAKIKLSTELRKLRDRMQELALAGEKGSEEYVQLSQKASEYRDAVDKVNAEVKVFADDLVYYRAGADALQGLAAGGQAAMGVIQLMGVENEKLVESIAKLQAVMAITNSLQQVSNLLRKESRLILVGKAVATKAATVAQMAWNAALGLGAKAIVLMTGGLVLIIPLIITLIKNFDKIIDSAKSVARWLGLLSKEVETAETKTRDYKKEIEDLDRVSKANLETKKHEINLLKAKGAGIDEVKEAERDLLMTEIQATRQRIELKMQEAQAVIRANKSIARMAGITEERIKQYYRESEGLEQLEKQLQVFDAAEQTRIQNVRNRAAEREKARLEQVEKEKKQLEQQRRDELQREEKAAMELSVLQAETEEERLQARVAQIQRLSEIELENESLTESERLLIKAESFNAIQELENQYFQERLDREREHREQLKHERELESEAEKQRLADLAEFEKSITDARIDTAFALSDTFKEISGEQSTIAKAVKSIQKGIALAEIGINLQRELAAIRVAAAVQNALIPGSGIIAERVQSIRAIAQAGAGIAKVIAMNTGGVVPGSGSKDTVPLMATPGEGVLRKQAMESKDNFTVTGTPKQIASRLNTMYGGVEFRNRGGIIGTGQAAMSTRAAGDESGRETLREMFSKIKIVTTIEDINNGISSEAARNELANYV